MAASLQKQYLAYAKQRQNPNIPLGLPTKTGGNVTPGPANEYDAA